MPDRREFFKVAGAGMAAMVIGREGFGAPADPTWLSYAIHVELFWKGLPFLDRLRKVSEAGFGRYEFWRWRTKDIEAITRLGDELGLQAVLFTGYRAVDRSKWREGLLDSVADSAELAPRLGAARLAIDPPGLDPARDRDEQVEELVEALKEAAEKVAGSEVTLILEKTASLPGRPMALIGSHDAAAAVVKAVGSARVKFAFEVRRGTADADSAVESIRKFRDQAGYYRVADLGHPDGAPDLPRVLKAIHDAGYADPIGLAIAERADPMIALDEIRKGDAAARGR